VVVYPFQIGTAVAVIAITAVQLANVTSWQGLLDQKLCMASADPRNLNVCTYIYAVGGVSIVMTIIIGLLQVSTQASNLYCASTLLLTAGMQQREKMA